MARRTFAQYKAEILHALGNPDPADLDIDEGDIVNDALEHVAALHPWNWLQTGETTLNIVADQDFVNLPSDFGTEIAIQHDEGWARLMIPTTWAELLRMRQDTIQGWTGTFWYVINTGNVTSGSEEQGLAAPTLNLYPTPSDNQTDGIRLVYRRFLRRMTGNNDVPQWPSYMDRPLSLLARSFATVDYDDNPISAYTDQFRAMIDDCKATDGLSQGSFGVQRGGIWPRTVPVSPYYPHTRIPDPTHITQ